MSNNIFFDIISENITKYKTFKNVMEDKNYIISKYGENISIRRFDEYFKL